MPDEIQQSMKTIVSVHGYAGDAHQIKALMPCYEHHNLPIVIVTPDDSRIESAGPHICRFAGKRQYIGADSLRRQLAQWKLLLDFNATHFLCNDSDSFCLSPKLPEYLYKEDVLWSNEVSDLCHKRPVEYPLPRLAFQPPYFLSRNILEKLIAAAPAVEIEGIQTPFIDWFFMAVAVKGNIPHNNFRDGMSCCTRSPHGLRVMTDMVWRHGKIFVHSVKSGPVRRQLQFARKQYTNRHV
jgi:hypothetical protein